MYGLLSRSRGIARGRRGRPLTGLRPKYLQYRPFRLLEGEFLVAHRFIDLHLEQRKYYAVIVFRAVDVDDFREGHAVVDFPIAIARVAEDLALEIENHLAHDVQRQAVEPNVARDIQFPIRTRIENVEYVGGIIFVGKIYGCGALLWPRRPDQQGIQKDAGPHVFDFIGRRNIEGLVASHDELVLRWHK